MAATKEKLEYINSLMKEIEFLNRQYMDNDEFTDFSTPIITSAHLVKILLEELLRENGYIVENGRVIMKDGGEDIEHKRYGSVFAFCIYSEDSMIPDEYKEFLDIILKNRNDEAHGCLKTKAEMHEFSKAYNCFVCWFFESFDIFGEENMLKEEILKQVDILEKGIGAPITIEYVKKPDGGTQRLLRYANALGSLTLCGSAEEKEELDESSGTTMSIKDETFGNDDLKRYISKCMKEAVDNINGTINDSRIELGEKIDNVTYILNNLIEQITSYQSLVENQMELAITADEIDRIVHAYSEECVNKIMDGVDKKYSKIQRNEEEKELISKLGKDLWEKKLTPESRNFLVSSKVTYKYYLNIDTLDFSGVCLLVTKALEVEMSARFYAAYVAFLKQGYTDSWKNHLDDFPTPLIKKIDGGRKLKSAKDFTLGSVSYILTANEDKTATEAQRRNNERRLVEFAKDSLMPGKSDEEILITLKEFGGRIADITEDYRNKAAHTNELKRVDAETCFKIVLDTEQLLKKMLETFAF